LELTRYLFSIRQDAASPRQNACLVQDTKLLEYGAIFVHMHDTHDVH